MGRHLQYAEAKLNWTHVPPFKQAIVKHKLDMGLKVVTACLISQFKPENPFMQKQTAWLVAYWMQRPPFKQNCEEHKADGAKLLFPTISHLLPYHPVGHWHVAKFRKYTHVPPFKHWR